MKQRSRPTALTLTAILALLNFSSSRSDLMTVAVGFSPRISPSKMLASRSDA